MAELHGAMANCCCECPCFFHNKTQHVSKLNVGYVHDHIPVSEPLLDGKIQHSPLPATTEGPQPAELGTCFGFSAPAFVLWGLGTASAQATDSKAKAGGKGWLEGSGQGQTHGRRRLLCLHLSGRDEKMTVL